MITRRAVAVLALPLVLSLAACGSTESGSGSTSTGTGTSSSPSSSAPATTSSGGGSSSGATGSDGSGADAVALVARIKAATASVTSVQFTNDTSLAGTTIKGTGAQRLSRGTLVALRIVQQLPNGEQQIIIVGDKTYLKQPGISTEPGKPYVLVSASSGNPLIRRLATTLTQARSAASVQSAVGFLAAADSVKDEGKAEVAGQQATHYRVVVDPTKLPSSIPNAAALKNAGLSSLPIDIYLDGAGRPVRTVTKVTVQGKTVASTFTVTRYNGTVTIQAPPAGQVSTR